MILNLITVPQRGQRSKRSSFNMGAFIIYPSGKIYLHLLITSFLIDKFRFKTLETEPVFQRLKKSLRIDFSSHLHSYYNRVL